MQTLIRKLELEYLDEVMQLWLNTNISAHAFVDRGYWENAYGEVKQMLPSAEIFIYHEENVKGFIGVTEKSYIAGLFVDNNYQSQGIGTELLNYCKSRYPHLELDVFVRNEGAVRFYQKNGFTQEQTKMNPECNQQEYHMSWSE